MKIHILLLLAGIPLFTNAQSVKYVKSDASGANDGSTWQNAFTTLQPALQSASYGDQIWVAQGTYLPTDGTDREISFLLPNGVSIWGGFDGTELSFAQRNIVANQTILSGDIGLVGVRDDNVYHIILIQAGDTLSIVDGFTITQGNADGNFDISMSHGGGILVLADEINPLVTPIIRNCRFEQNRGNRGGAIACLGSDQYVSTPAISSCVFIQNRGEEYAASIYKEGVNRGKRPFKVENCLFERNFCKLVSGGIVVNNASGIVQLRGCTFLYDTGIVEVGAVYLITGNKKIQYEIDSCNFTGNYSKGACGGLNQIVLGTSLDTVKIFINKSTFLGNHNFVGEAGGFTSFGSSNFHGVYLKDCVFNANYSQNGGGGIFIDDAGGTSSEVNIDRCYFLGNQTTAASVNGAFFYRGFGSTPVKNTTTITNSVFMYNTGSISSLGNYPGKTNTRVVNCSFYRNGNTPFLKYWGVENNPVSFISKMQILNCVIWEPQADGVQRVFYNDSPVNFSVNDYLIEHSMIHLADCTYNSVDPCGEGMIYGEWPDFVDTFGGVGLVPYPYFKGLNQGSSLVADTFGLLKDYRGLYRVCDTAVDMGAYEVQVNCTVGAFVPGISVLPVGIKILSNPVAQGEPIMAEISAAADFHLRFMLTDLQGHLVWQDRKFAPTYLPGILSIDAGNLQPGIYLLHIMDESGRSKVEKVVVL